MDGFLQLFFFFFNVNIGLTQDVFFKLCGLIKILLKVKTEAESMSLQRTFLEKHSFPGFE